MTKGIANTHKKLLAHAEVALFWAKQTNIDISIFDEEMPIYKELKRNIELTKEIKQALKDDNILMYAQKIINNRTKEVFVDGEPIKLTPIEYKLLFFLATNKGQVFSIKQI